MSEKQKEVARKQALKQWHDPKFREHVIECSREAMQWLWKNEPWRFEKVPAKVARNSLKRWRNGTMRRALRPGPFEDLVRKFMLATGYTEVPVLTSSPDMAFHTGVPGTYKRRIEVKSSLVGPNCRQLGLMAQQGPTEVWFLDAKTDTFIAYELLVRIAGTGTITDLRTIAGWSEGRYGDWVGTPKVWVSAEEYSAQRAAKRAEVALEELSAEESEIGASKAKKPTSPKQR